MKKCPSCLAEYRVGIVECAHCKVPLVSPEEAGEVGDAQRNARQILEGAKTVNLSTGARLEGAREIERNILNAGIPCFLVAVESDDVTLSAAMMNYELVVAEEDAQRVFETFKDRYEAMVAQEGTGAMVNTVVNLDDDEVQCPACGHKGALVEGACSDCELFLGAP